MTCSHVAKINSPGFRILHNCPNINWPLFYEVLSTEPTGTIVQCMTNTNFENCITTFPRFWSHCSRDEIEELDNRPKGTIGNPGDKNTVAATVMSSTSWIITGCGTIAVAIATKAFLSRSKTTELKGSPPCGDDHSDTKPTRDRLKTELRALLSKHDGDTKHPDIVEAVEELATLNPVPTHCSESLLFPGDYYTLSAPPFPGKIENEKGGPAQFTLGRLSFNIFQPNKLVCTVKSIRNLIVADDTKSDDGTKAGAATFTYDFHVDLIVHTSSEKNGEEENDSDLEATMINKGFCSPSPDANNRLNVTFTGSSLIPKKENDKAADLLWAKNFANAYQKADQERSYMGWALHYGLKWFLGLVYPNDTNALDGGEAPGFHFEMKKPLSFYFDVLYLDEDIRITKGSRGTIDVVDRLGGSSGVVG